jgi:hypothetical protein
MIFTTITFWLLIETFLLKNTNSNNIILSNLISSLSTIIIFLILYLLVEKIFNGHSIIPTLITYFISISLGQIISYYILSLKKNYNTLNVVSLILIPIIFTVFGFFTYNPVKTKIFYDQYKDKYGIYNYYTLDNFDK